MSSVPPLIANLFKILSTRDEEYRALLLQHSKLRIHVDLFLRLYRQHRPHLATFHTFLVDQVSHRYWRYRNPEAFGERPSRRQARFRSAVEDAYVRTDEALGRILRHAPPDSIVAVLSEHGMSPEPVSNEAGSWQYLIRGSNLAAFIGLPDEFTVCPIARWMSFRPRTTRSLAADAARRFRAIRVVETGLPLFSVYDHGKDEVIVKFSIDRGNPRYARGDLESLHVEFDGRRLAFIAIARRGARQRSAMHDQRAMLILSGPGIRKGHTLPDASITDFAPTLLQAAGLPHLEGIDGNPLEVFEFPLPVG